MTPKQARRQAIEIAKLKAKHRGHRYTVPFPDLACDPSVCTNLFGMVATAVTWKKPVNPTHPTAIVSHLHKSSYQVLSRSEIQYAGRKV